MNSKDEGFNFGRRMLSVTQPPLVSVGRKGGEK